MKPFVLAIQGPTAIGKTALAVELGLYLNAPVISADSRQFYKEISIGTAKPSIAEMKGVPHYFINSHSIHAPVNAAHFETEALQLIQKDLKNEPYIILVGGSGLFIDALLEGLDPLPTDENIRAKWEKEYDEHGIEHLQAVLKEKDADSHTTMDIQNSHRVIRALELIEITGKVIKDIRLNEAKERPFDSLRLVLDMPREMLYERINLRVHEMIEQGLEEEVRGVLSFKNLQSLNTVGYKEMFAYIDGSCTLQTAIEAIQQNSRRYAKRQLTWFRKNPDNNWLTAIDTQERLQIILKMIQK